jgi:ATP-dependent DNA helicase RecG
MLAGITVPTRATSFGDRPLRIELLTNRVTGNDRKDVLHGLADGSVDLAIGTHALIQDGRRDSTASASSSSTSSTASASSSEPALRDKAAVRRSRRARDDRRRRSRARSDDGLRRPRRERARRALRPVVRPISTSGATARSRRRVWSDVRNEAESVRQSYASGPLIDEARSSIWRARQETCERLSVGELARSASRSSTGGWRLRTKTAVSGPLPPRPAHVIGRAGPP